MMSPTAQPHRFTAATDGMPFALDIAQNWHKGEKIMKTTIHTDEATTKVTTPAAILEPEIEELEKIIAPGRQLNHNETFMLDETSSMNV